MIQRAIYTWKSTTGHYKGFTKRGIEVMKLSVESANKFYDTELFCDSKSKSLFIKNKIPFKKITVVDWLDNFKSKNWGLAKLETMRHQTSEYVHLDLDTILVKKLKEFDEDICWGYYEVDFSSIKEHGNDKLKWKDIKYVLENYINIALKYEKDRIDDFDFSVVPNNSLMIVNKPYPIGDMITKLMEMTSDYNGPFDVSKNMFMEQFLFHQLVIHSGYISNTAYSHGKTNTITDVGYTTNPITLDGILERGFFHWDMFSEFTEDTYNLIFEKIISMNNLHDSRLDKHITYNDLIF